jgi:hypothetical protein
MTKWQLVGVGINEIRLPIKSFAVKIKKTSGVEKNAQIAISTRKQTEAWKILC